VNKEGGYGHSSRIAWLDVMEGTPFGLDFLNLQLNFTSKIK